jgi:HPt (histidine-containing phosphotransfer) domain-containing protein
VKVKLGSRHSQDLVNVARDRIRGPAYNREVGTATAIDIAVVEGLLEWIGAPARLESLLHTYDSQVKAAIREMGDAADGADRAALRRAAHSLRGTSATFGAAQVAEVCMHLETDDIPAAELRVAVDTLAAAHAEFSLEIMKVLAAADVARDVVARAASPAATEPG